MARDTSDLKLIKRHFASGANRGRLNVDRSFSEELDRKAAAEAERLAKIKAGIFGGDTALASVPSEEATNTTPVSNNFTYTPPRVNTSELFTGGPEGIRVTTKALTEAAKFRPDARFAWVTAFLSAEDKLDAANIKESDINGANALSDSLLKDFESHVYRPSTRIENAAIKIDHFGRDENGEIHPDFMEASRELEEARKIQAKLEEEYNRRVEEYIKEKELLDNASASIKTDTSLTDEERSNSLDRIARKRAEYEAYYKNQMKDLLPLARKSSLAAMKVEAVTDLAVAKQSPNKQEDITAAEERVALIDALKKQTLTENDSGVGLDLEDARTYKGRVEAGEEARKILRSKKFEEYVGVLNDHLDTVYADKIAKAKSANPIDHETQVADLKAEKEALQKKVAGTKDKPGLAEQIVHVDSVLTKAGLKDSERQAFRARMFEQAINYTGNSEQFASNFLHSEPELKKFAPVVVPAGANRVDILADGRVKITDYVPGEEERVTWVSKEVAKNGLDFAQVDGKDTIIVQQHVDSADNPLYVYGTQGKRLSYGVTSDQVAVNVTERNDERARAYDNLVVVGGNEALEGRIAVNQIAARAAHNKRQQSVGLAMARALDGDGNGALDLSELAAMDKNGDGMLSGNEVPKEFRTALMKFKNGDSAVADMIKKLSTDGGEVSIADLGKFTVPAALPQQIAAAPAGRTTTAPGG